MPQWSQKATILLINCKLDMKTKHFVIALFLMALMAVTACRKDEGPVKATGIKLDYSELELTKGQSFSLKATVLPENAEDKNVQWSSSNEDVASVDATGKIIAFTLGSTTITAFIEDIKAECEVTVVAVEVESVEVTPPTLELVRGETGQLSATVLPDNAEDRTVLWSSSDETVATVDQTGKVTAVAPGQATIMGMSGDKGDVCEVTVSGIPVESVTIDRESLEMAPEDIIVLTAEVLPEDADDKALVWTSSDENVVTVSDGKVTAVSVGEAVITATAGGISDECPVTVIAPAAKGDYYYSDGTYSSELDQSKTVIGVVFWIGDPTASDPTLKLDHPDCTHGLVVCMTEPTEPGEFSGDETTYWQKSPSSVSDWIILNAPEYVTIATEAYDEGSENLNRILGYNNTKAIEAYNADPDNASMIVEAVQRAVKYRDEVPAPENTSDWYLPSAKELSLLWNGECSDGIFGYGESDGTLELVNDKIWDGGGTEVDTWHTYWSSTEYTDATYAFCNAGQTMFQKKNDVYSFVRFILAF